MKKKILFIAALALLTIGFTSCEKQSAGKTQITYYANLQLKGASVMGVNVGTEYVEPGFTATMNGIDVTDKVQVSSNVDASKKGVYSVVYSIVNEDGFLASASRTVVVYNFNSPIEGIWDVDPASYRIYDGGSPTPYKGAYQVLFWDGETDGQYEAEDLMAGWYCQRAGYGANYAMGGNISVADDGTITLIDSKVPGWGDSADALENGKFDAATNTITYKLTYASVIEFYVTLHKVVL